ncbi:unnamed protein product [Gordionus sp. m RMFG-2023]
MFFLILRLAFIIIIIYLTSPGSSLFSWHPFMMVLGYLGFMLEAVGVFAKPPKLSTEDNLNILSNVLAPA